MKKTAFLIPALVAVLTLAGCGETGADKSPVLATVDGEAITEKDYEDYLQARQGQFPPIQDKDKEKEVVLDEMINRVVLVQNAVKNKVDQEPDVYFQLKRQRENVLARAMLRKYFNDNPITDEEVENRYKQELEKMHRTEYRARHILLKTEDEAKQVIQSLGGKRANFAAVAKSKSTDPQSAKNGGDLGWFNQGQMVPAFFDAVKAMHKGETSREPVKTEFGWHVIRIEDERPLQAPSFDQVKGGVRRMVQQERIDAMVKEAREKAKVKIN